MSFDLCVWASGNGEPEQIYNDVCEDDDRRLVSSKSALQFRSALLDRWRILKDAIEPFEYDPDVEVQSNLDRYVLITMPYRLVGEVSDMVAMAREYGLTVYDPQCGKVVS